MNKKKLITLLVASVAIYFVMKYLRDQKAGNTTGNASQQQQSGQQQAA